MSSLHLLTCSGWGLNNKVFSRLPYPQTHLSWEKWLTSSPAQRQAHLQHTLDQATTPLFFIGLSLGGFLAHDLILNAINHPKLSGAAFCSIAASFVKNPLHASPTSPSNPYGIAAADLNAMMHPLLAFTSQPPPQKDTPAPPPPPENATIMNILQNFINAGLSQQEHAALPPPQHKDHPQNNLAMSYTATSPPALLAGLKFLQRITLTPPPKAVTKPLLVIQGASDAIIDARGVKAWARTCQYTHHSLAGAGHFTPFTASQKLLEILHHL